MFRLAELHRLIDADSTENMGAPAVEESHRPPTCLIAYSLRRAAIGRDCVAQIGHIVQAYRRTPAIEDQG